MRNLFLTYLLVLVAGVASAGDSGLYYDELRNGEGILMVRNADTFVVYFFTYGAKECYEVEYEDSDKDEWECDYNGQRWFYAVVEPEEEDEPSIDAVGDEISGTMFATSGLNYPEGEPHDLIPFVHNVGKNIAVGKFAMRRNLDGWLMDVAPTGDYLDEDDPLFTRIFKFEKRLFTVSEGPIAEPK